MFRGIRSENAAITPAAYAAQSFWLSHFRWWKRFACQNHPGGDCSVQSIM
jgi:hypothetical protein